MNKIIHNTQQEKIIIEDLQNSEAIDFTELAVQREKEAALLSQFETLVIIVNNIVSNISLSFEFKIQLLLTTIPEYEVLIGLLIEEYQNDALHNNEYLEIADSMIDMYLNELAVA